MTSAASGIGTAVPRIARLVGKENVLLSRVSLDTYAGDATNLRGHADVVVFPRSTDEVAAVVRACREEGIPITPRGHGTDLSGGAVPNGGVVMSFARMNRILKIDPGNRYATVQPGVVNSTLQKAVGRHGLMYAPDPASQAVCSLGGNAAKGAGGMRGLKYGVTKDHVLGMTVVLADGQVARTGGPLEPPGAGPDWTGLLIGAEGTLALITELTLRLVVEPPSFRTLLAVFDRIEDAGEAVSRIVASGIIPATLELMDGATMEAVEAFAHAGLPTGAQASLLVEVDGFGAGLDGQVESIVGVCRACGAREVRAASSPSQRDSLWLARRAALGAVARLRPNYDLEDITVPRTRLPEMLKTVAQIGRDYRVDICIIAHAGDGNLHPIIVFDDRDEEERARVAEARQELFRRALAAGGTLSGEHGIGLLKKRFMPLLYPAEVLATLGLVKRAFDPDCILNPGKVLEEESRHEGR